jgi:cell division protein FtsQ
MAHKQAKRRTKKVVAPMQLQKIKLGKIFTLLFAITVLVATYQLSLTMFDKDITSIEISGPFQRVTALHIEDAISEEIDAGFIGADIDRIQDLIVALPWVDQARVVRRWPSRILITINEQAPAAVWRDNGLLNTRGELFIEESRHIPAELPRLSGPDNSSAEVAKRYLTVRKQLIPRGLDVRRIQVNARGSWEMTLGNGIDVRLGRKAAVDRMDLFLNVVTDIITSRGTEIDYVDMRYGNGFAIGWKDNSQTPISDPEKARQKMLLARGIN